MKNKTSTVGITLRGRRSSFLWSILIASIILILIIFYSIQNQWSFRWILESWKPYFILILGFIAIIIISAFAFQTFVRLSRSSPESYVSPDTYDPTLILSTLTPDYSKQLISSNQRMNIDLLVRRDMHRLAHFIMTPNSSKVLLTGYESFGGTSLVQGATQIVRHKLREQGHSDANLLVFNFSVTNTRNTNKLSIEINGFKFAHLQSNFLHNSSDDLVDLASNIPSVYLTTPLRASVLSGITQTLTRNLPNNTLDVDVLASGLEQLFEDNFRKSPLKHEIRHRVKDDARPLHAVIILDRIDSIETLKTLSLYELFKNPDISVIAVARKEHFDEWENSDFETRKLGFEPEYIPCLWNDEEDYIEPIIQEMFDIYNTPSIDATTLKKHFEYVGRGVLGNLLKELHNNLLRDDAERHIMQIYRPQRDIEHNAWRQMMLDKNWNVILGGVIVGSEQVDRARIGVYHLLQWIHKNPIFTFSELSYAAKYNMEISIHSNATIVTGVIWNLLEVLRQNRYLVKDENTYKRNWQEDAPPEIREVDNIASMQLANVEEASASMPIYIGEVSLNPGQPQVDQTVKLYIKLKSSSEIGNSQGSSRIVHVCVSSDTPDLTQGTDIKSLILNESATEIVEFELIFRSPGKKNISIDLFHDTNHFWGHTLKVVVADYSTELQWDNLIKSPIDIAEKPPQSGPNITFIVSNNQLNSGEHKYSYLMLFRNQKKFYPDHFEAEQIHPESHAIYRTTFKQLNQSITNEDELHSLGVNLYRGLIPEPLKKRLWQELYSHNFTGFPNVQIVSKDVWIPWEFLRLYDPNTNQEGEYLCEKCNLTRCLSGASFPTEIYVKKIGLIIDKTLPAAKVEADFIKQLFGSKVTEIPFSKDKITQALKQGGYSIFHFICHGTHNPGNPDESTISLQGSETISPSYINGDRTQCRIDTPFVFMNVCETGQSERALTGMGGWAEAFIRQTKSSGFIGSIWQVQDQTASKFSAAFYKHLLNRKAIGESVRLARQEVKRTDDSSWLSYTVYADPMARLKVD